MRKQAVFSNYNRYVMLNSERLKYREPSHTCMRYRLVTDMGKSLLGLFAAMETPLLKSFVDWSDGDGTEYGLSLRSKP